MDSATKDAVRAGGQVFFTEYLDFGIGILMLYYGGLAVMANQNGDGSASGGLTIGRLITFQLYWNKLTGSVEDLSDLISELTRAAGAAGRVFALLDAAPDLDPHIGEEVSESDLTGGKLVLQDLEFTYQSRPDSKVLEGVSLSIPMNNVTALVGRSGAGKSTVMHLLMRFYEPTSGKILLNGRDLASVSAKSLHDWIGLVAQETQLFAASVED